MKNLMDYTLKERQEIILVVADTMKMSPVIIEKDYWVSWLINVLFSCPYLQRDIVFKGGTSLSKGYNAINRFSEDIDISLSRKLIGFNTDLDYYKNLTNSKRRRVIRKEMVPKYLKYLETEFKNKLDDIIRENIDNHPFEVEYVPVKDKEHFTIKYPKSIEDELGYIHSYIKIDPGIKSMQFPVENKKIIPFIYQELSELSTDTEYVDVSCLSIERTFYEKITLLHSVYYRANNLKNAFNKGLSRHYYDVYKLIKQGSNVRNLSLLSDVVEHKKTFYTDNNSNYDEALSAIKLLPHDDFYQELKNDYKDMEVMFYDRIPSFDEIIDTLRDYESIFEEQLGRN